MKTINKTKKEIKSNNRIRKIVIGTKLKVGPLRLNIR
jgi:hypothetical protein